MTFGKKKRLTLGRMRHRCTIQSPVVTKDAKGQSVVSSWTDVFKNEPCSFVPGGGGEAVRGRQLEENVRAVFELNYRDGYTTKMRVVFGTETFGITYVNRIDGIDRYIELVCMG